MDFSANVTLKEETVMLNNTSSNRQGGFIAVAFPIPVGIEERTVSFVLILSNCAGSNHSDPLEIGWLTT